MVGVHLTPHVDGQVLIGPNAALALAKEGYKFWHISLRDALLFATTKGLWKLVFGKSPDCIPGNMAGYQHACIHC